MAGRGNCISFSLRSQSREKQRAEMWKGGRSAEAAEGKKGPPQRAASCRLASVGVAVALLLLSIIILCQQSRMAEAARRPENPTLGNELKQESFIWQRRCMIEEPTLKDIIETPFLVGGEFLLLPKPEWVTINVLRLKQRNAQLNHKCEFRDIPTGMMRALKNFAESIPKEAPEMIRQAAAKILSGSHSGEIQRSYFAAVASKYWCEPLTYAGTCQNSSYELDECDRSSQIYQRVIAELGLCRAEAVKLCSKAAPLRYDK